MPKEKFAPKTFFMKELKKFLKSIDQVLALPTSKKYDNLVLPEYPFDAQLITVSSIYRTSRMLYMKGGGKFSPKVCSVARSLSSQDLFQSYIEYSPVQTELLWFHREGHREVSNPLERIDTFLDLNGVSLFHEQNHRIVWASLPPPPQELWDLQRYLNFSESLVVTLDLALADQMGPKLSPVFEGLKTLYRTTGKEQWNKKSKKEYRQYLYAVLVATYCLLELYEPKDIGKGLQKSFPGSSKLVKDAVHRSRDLSELFVRQTNQLWQDRYLSFAQVSLNEMHADSDEGPFYLPDNPLEIGVNEFKLVDQVFKKFGL